MIFRLFWAYVGQPGDHTGWGTSMPFASFFFTYPRTNPWNFCEKILRIGGAGDIIFVFWLLGFSKKLFFVLEWKSAWLSYEVYLFLHYGSKLIICTHEYILEFTPTHTFWYLITLHVAFMSHDVSKKKLFLIYWVIPSGKWSKKRWQHFFYQKWVETHPCSFILSLSQYNLDIILLL